MLKCPCTLCLPNSPHISRFDSRTAIPPQLLYAYTVVVAVRLVVCGGKQFKDYDLLDRALSAVHQKRHIRHLIVGGLPGAEQLAHIWAVRIGIDMIITKPTQFDLAGRRSIALRNVTIFRELRPDGVVAFPGRSETEHMIQVAEEYGVTVWKVPPDWK